MTSIIFQENGKQATLPSSWDELTASQIQFIFRTHDECLRKGLSPLDFNIRVLYHLLGLRRRIPFWKIKSTSFYENLYLLCEQCLGFLFASSDTQTKSLTLSCKRVDNPLPIIRISPFKRLYGPGTLCQNLTFGEFRMAATALNQFFKSSDPEELDECIRHLYRPASRHCNRAGRYVRPIGDDGSPKELETIRKIPFWQKNLILVWFSSCLEWIQQKTIIIDGEEVNMKLLFNSEESSSSKNDTFTWSDLLVQIAREGSIGTMAEVDREPLFSVFGIMWSNYKENKRYEKAAKTSKA
jgi:hypothetical protein